MLPVPLLGHIAGYWQDTLTIIGGYYDSDPSNYTVLNPNNYTYTRVITPYANFEANGSNLQFASGDWSSSDLSLPSLYTSMSKIYCLFQCQTQIDDVVYVYGTTNEMGVLLQYNLSAQAFVDVESTSSSYDSTSDSSLSYSCVTNNGSHVFVIGGYDGQSNAPWHEIQTFEVSTGQWVDSGMALITPRTMASCAVVDGALYVFGGWTTYLSEMTHSVEMVDLGTGQSTTLDATLDRARVGSQAMADGMGRIWIIGGSNLEKNAIDDVEVFDPSNHSMVSTEVPIKYASTLYDARASAVWYDGDNDIMFVAGGFGGNGYAATADVQYLFADVVGKDAYPTPPPSYVSAM